MRDIVLLCPDNNTSSRLKNTLSQAGLYVSAQAYSAPEALSIANNRTSDGILICFGISPVNVSKLIQIIPASWDVLVLLFSGQTPPMLTSNSTYMNLPLDKQNFIQTVSFLCVSSVSSFSCVSSYSGIRTREEREIIDRAKKIIMEQNRCSENDAYKFIRTKSMNSGVKIYQTAKEICRNHPGKE